jgi:histone H3/H4
MAVLTRANKELFQRPDDERFSSMDELLAHCRQVRDHSMDRWDRPGQITLTSDLNLAIGDNPDLVPNNWSFRQLCRLAGVAKDTLDRLTPKTASRVLQETLPCGDKPWQILTADNTVRSIHGVSYTRLWNEELLTMLRDFAGDFQPPQKAIGGGTGLYCGEQDMFCFLIDPLGWTEIDGEAFAPGMFVWNSEVGRRSLGIQTFWFQAVCQNHLVWDAVEVVEFSRKHTANVRDGLDDIRFLVADLVKKRDQRRDGFVRVVRKAMQERLGDGAEEAMKKVVAAGIPTRLAQEAIECAQRAGRLTIFSVVDALTRISQRVFHAGDRTELDAKAAALLALAA